jgi:peptidoglycan-N-acetylglucosamine deacetylase
VKRICDMYARHGIHQTFFIPAWCTEQHPDIVETVLEDGHEIAHHGYIHESPNKQESVEDERYWLEKGIDIIERMTGQKPRGWRAPLYHFSEFSADLLIENGFLYDASLMGDDVPYIIKTNQGEMVELPSHWGMDDWNHYAHISELHSDVPTKAPEEAMKRFSCRSSRHTASMAVSGSPSGIPRFQAGLHAGIRSTA